MFKNYSRRDFLRVMGVTAGGLALTACEPLLNSFGRHPGSTPITGPMPYRVLGQTGDSVSLFGLGGEAAIEGADAELAAEIINEAIDLGVNYLDTSAWYPGGSNQGRSERNIGQVLQTRRKEVFLATKSHGLNYSAVMSHVEDSLSNLKTDQIDLYQLHNVRFQTQLDQIFDKDDGALKAMERLREQGVIRHIGITGHYDSQILLQAINQHPFDAILLSLNVADKWDQPFQEELLTTALDKKMGIIAMKVAGKGDLVNKGSGEAQLTMERLMWYVYSFPVSCAIIGIHSVSELHEDLDITARFPGSYSADELAALEDDAYPFRALGNQWKK